MNLPRYNLSPEFKSSARNGIVNRVLSGFGALAGIDGIDLCGNGSARIWACAEIEDVNPPNAVAKMRIYDFMSGPFFMVLNIPQIRDFLNQCEASHPFQL